MKEKILYIIDDYINNFEDYFSDSAMEIDDDTINKSLIFYRIGQLTGAEEVRRKILKELKNE